MKLRILFADYGSQWTNTHVEGNGNPGSAAAKRLYDEHGVRIHRSAPGAHLLDVENSIGRIRAVSNMMLIYMHVAAKMVSWALVHACTVLNILSKPKSKRPVLADGTSPGSAYMMAFYDVSRLIAPLFSYAIDKTKN